MRPTEIGESQISHSLGGERVLALPVRDRRQGWQGCGACGEKRGDDVLEKTNTRRSVNESNPGILVLLESFWRQEGPGTGLRIPHLFGALPNDKVSSRGSWRIRCGGDVWHGIPKRSLVGLGHYNESRIRERRIRRKAGMAVEGGVLLGRRRDRRRSQPSAMMLMTFNDLKMVKM